jgi:hypothetical protein
MPFCFGVFDLRPLRQFQAEIASQIAAAQVADAALMHMIDNPANTYREPQWYDGHYYPAGT